MITSCKSKPYRKLLLKCRRSFSRNNRGIITVRHRGGSHKRRYRNVDFHRGKAASHGLVERIEYDPNRNARIALVLHQSGERKYIIAPHGLVSGARVLTSPNAPISTGNHLPLGCMPIGTRVHCLEIVPNSGAKVARAAGTFAILVTNQGIFSKMKLQSGEVRLMNKSCTATVGEVGNAKHNLVNLRKAGSKRWRGIRPTVRGVAMNPIDHPHGGGEGKTAAGRNPVSPWGVLAKGYKTRKSRSPGGMIVTRRSQ